MKSSRSGVLTLLLFVAVQPLLAEGRLDPRESRRFVGREDDVRVDAQLVTPQLRPNGTVQVVFEVHNFRNESIALDPNTTSCDYDAQSGVAMLIVGAEVPDEKRPPRLVVLHSGEKRTFTVAARVSMPPALSLRSQPRMVQLKLNYLGDVKPFTPIMNAAAPPAVDLFSAWVENNVAVVTNSLPFDVAAVNAPSRGDATQSRPSGGAF